MIKKYRKKPVVIEALVWTGENVKEIKEFCGLECFYGFNGLELLYIKTLEGNHLARIGDYIIKGVKGEFYPCKPDIFKLTYEVEND